MSFDGSASLRCISCGSIIPYDPYAYFCPRCGHLLEVLVSEPGGVWNKWRLRPLGVWRYREALPIGDCTAVSLGEGGTPLLRLSERNRNAYVKFEGANPTGSFKDRGMTVGVSIAKCIGASSVLAASTGNTASSMAAYAARASLRPIVLLPVGGVARGKLSQAVLHGATVIEVHSGFDQALEAVIRAARKSRDVYPLNSFNPIRLEGQKTLAYEIVDQLSGVPNHVIVPVGNGGNIAAIWKGFKELYNWGAINELPVMIGVQAEGASPLVMAWKDGATDTLPVVMEPRTVASAIRIGRPVNWLKAIKAVKESRGIMVSVPDHEIISAMEYMARIAGIGVEPSSAASLAGYFKLLDEGVLDEGDTVVLVATGHSLKDPDASTLLSAKRLTVSTIEEAVNAVLGEPK